MPRFQTMLLTQQDKRWLWSGAKMYKPVCPLRERGTAGVHVRIPRERALVPTQPWRRNDRENMSLSKGVLRERSKRRKSPKRSSTSKGKGRISRRATDTGTEILLGNDG